MKTPLLIAAPFLCGALLVGAASPALADGAPSPAPTATHGPVSLSGIQAKGAAATSKRIDSLNTAITRVTSAKGFTSSDRSTVLGTFDHDLAGMKDLAAKIAADTTVSTAAADLRSVDTEYRVYAVALPQARIAGVADRLTGTAIPRLKTVAGKLAPKVAGNADLQAKLDDLTTQVATASSDTDGLATAALAVTPSAYDGNHDVMSTLRDTTKAAAAAAKQAAQDAKAIVQGLKAAPKPTSR